MSDVTIFHNPACGTSRNTLALIRMVVGQTHRVIPKYMFDYTSEVAWREDIRRSSPSVLVKTLLTASLKNPQLG